MTAHRFAFSDRLSRIEAGRGSFRSLVFVDPEGVLNVPSRNPEAVRAKARCAVRFWKVMLVSAVVILACRGDLIARIAIHLSGIGLPTESTFDAFPGDAFLFAMCALHNLVHMSPQPFLAVPGGWAQMILSAAAPDTLLVRGNTIAL